MDEEPTLKDRLRGLPPSDPGDRSDFVVNQTYVSEREFQRLLGSIQRYEAQHGVSFWDIVVEQAVGNVSLLKHIVDKLLPSKHELRPTADPASQVEEGRLREMRAQLDRDLRASGRTKVVTLSAAPPPPEDEEILDAEVIDADVVDLKEVDDV